MSTPSQQIEIGRACYPAPRPTLAEELFSQAGIPVSLSPIEEQGGYGELFNVVSREISQRSGYDFDIALERQYFMNGVLDKEGLKNEVKTFIWEYLTDLRISRFTYTLNQEGTFGDGWSRSMEEMLFSSVEVASNSAEKDLRQAELDGFLKIKQRLLESPDKKAFYISPAEAYNSDFSLSYMFALRKDEAGNYVLEAQLYRIYNASILRHYDVLKALSGDNPREIDVNSPSSFIANPLFLESDEDIVEFLMRSYNEPLYEMEAQQELFNGFLEYIDQFIELFANPTHTNDDIEAFFKILLAKAMVYFNEREASNIFHPDILRQIKRSDLYRMSMNEELFNGILNTELNLSEGTCGTIGGFSIENVVKALYQASHPGIDMETKVFVCPRCGEVHDISNGYVQNCRKCGYSAVCK